METREQTEAREKKLVDDTKRLAQSGLRKLGINITNPLAGLDSLPTTEESLDPDSLKIYQDANKPIEQAQGFAKEGFQLSAGLYGAALSQYGTVGNQPRNMINITDQVEEIVDMHPSIYKRAGAIYRNHEGGISWKQAIAMAKSLPQGTGPNDPTVYIPPNERIGTQKGDPLQSVNPEFEQGYVAPGYKDIYKVQTRLINQNLTGPGKKFNWNAYRNGLRQNKKSGRTIATLYSTTPHSKIANWETHRQGLVGAYTSLYGKAMDKYGYTPSDIDVDHIFTLQQSMAIYHDVDWGGNLYNKIQEKILSRGYKPGNASSNLTAVDKQTHAQKSKFFNTLHGPNGTRFFNKARMQEMTGSEKGRMKVLNEYLDQIDEGARILNEGQTVWETLYSPNEIMPEDLVEKLAHIELNQYSTDRLRTIIEEIIRDYDLQEAMGRADLIEQVERQSAIDEPLPYKLEDDPLAKPYRVQSKKAQTRKFIKKVTEELPPDYGPLLNQKSLPDQISDIIDHKE